MLKTIKLIISYDGTNYYGFQIQESLPTVQQAILKALYMLTKQNISIYGSGRTDKGVHAIGQVVHFQTELNIPATAYVNGLNSYLPDDIKIISACNVDNDFHSRFSAKSKEYHYKIMKKFNLFERNYKAYYPNLDVNKMIEASKYLIGTHNFRGFCSSGVNELKNFERTIYNVEIIEEEDLITFKFIGSGFLKYQVRRMMGALIQIGNNKKQREFILEVLETKDPTVSKYVSDACGLYLVEVKYE